MVHWPNVKFWDQITIEVYGRVQCALARPLKAIFRIDRPNIDKIDQDRQNRPRSTFSIHIKYWHQILLSNMATNPILLSIETQPCLYSSITISCLLGLYFPHNPLQYLHINWHQYTTIPFNYFLSPLRYSNINLRYFSLTF